MAETPKTFGDIEEAALARLEAFKSQANSAKADIGQCVLQIGSMSHAMFGLSFSYVQEKINGAGEEDIQPILDQVRGLRGQVADQEIRKARLLGVISHAESGAQQVLDQQAQRLEIPKGITWKIEDGQAVEMKLEQPAG